MTTAHRPTWKAAVGKAQEGGWTAGGAASSSRSALDAAAHTKLKLRSKAVDKKAALRESLLKLEEAEAKAAPPKRTIVPAIEEEGRQRLLKQTAEVDEEKIKSKYDDADEDDGDDGSDSDGWDDVGRGGGDESDLDASDSESSDDDDEDDEEALQAELAKIRAEREAAKAAEEAEAAAEEAERLEEAALLGNPLLSAAGATSGKMKRRWNDDVVFRNQAKGEPEIKKRFINDTVRNDFHKRFLNKFVR